MALACTNLYINFVYMLCYEKLIYVNYAYMSLFPIFLDQYFYDVKEING